MHPRIQTAIAFLTSAIALCFASQFIMVDTLKPFLEGQDPATPALRAAIAGVYPFAQVTEVRMIYCAVALLPILIPLLARGRIAAWLTILLGTLLTLSNLSDGIFGFLLGGRAILGLGYVAAVGLPAAIGIGYAFIWAHTARPAHSSTGATS